MDCVFRHGIAVERENGAVPTADRPLRRGVKAYAGVGGVEMADCSHLHFLESAGTRPGNRRYSSGLHEHSERYQACR